MTSKKPGSQDPKKIPGERSKIFIALGANLPSPAGPPEATLRAALGALEARAVQVSAVSRFHRTSAWPDPSDPPFVNAVAEIRTELQPVALMELLHEVETAFGRKRSAPNRPRTLDLDLLDYRGRILKGAVELPHPRMAGRRFVLEPLAELAPGWCHPVSGLTVESLLEALT